MHITIRRPPHRAHLEIILNSIDNVESRTVSPLIVTTCQADARYEVDVNSSLLELAITPSLCAVCNVCACDIRLRRFDMVSSHTPMSRLRQAFLFTMGLLHFPLIAQH